MQNNTEQEIKGFNYPSEQELLQKSKSPQKKKIFQDPIPPPMPAQLNKQHPLSFENVKNPMDDSHLTNITGLQNKQISGFQNQSNIGKQHENQEQKQQQSEKVFSQSVINPMDLTEDEHQKQQEDDTQQQNTQKFKKNIKKGTQITIASRDDELKIHRLDSENTPKNKNHNISKLKENQNNLGPNYQSNIAYTEPSNVYPFSNIYNSQLTIGMEGHICSAALDQQDDSMALSGRKEEFLSWHSATYILKMFLDFTIVCLFLTIFLPCYLVTVPRQISKMPKKQKKICNNCNKIVNELEINPSQKPELAMFISRLLIICLYPILWLIMGYPFQKLYLDFILYVYQILYNFFSFAFTKSNQ
ncbi:transmembrane protein, putative (macronuclear) [Tetrahymena thermophila SB210]|uniref:Transmembrane protein, putative n=1 Tax=Tetrahymena thermophila (strain SB210) TaxID=312017 RepID=Q22KB2_TETTS|nr:transmembrane protein, putative [Tetrahymena thermophila SB210]EAR85887.1 transmembrane protein, putative [Tetrahymena thermophila SB210]|eukprot:XP_001033550.1 transmembrane protein, putative [Tetrahymena thermophila SB210]